MQTFIKRYIIQKKWLALFLLGVATSCSQDEAVPAEIQAELIGKWKLIEQLLDPGNGSGVLKPIISDKTLTFFSDGTYSSNGPTCTMVADSNQASSGTFSVNDSTITPDDCQSANYKIQFEIKGAHLILIYTCYEGCRQKYEKV